MMIDLTFVGDAVREGLFKIAESIGGNMGVASALNDIGGALYDLADAIREMKDAIRQMKGRS